MLGIAVQGGLEVTQDVEEADYVVVNTCGFLESAREESKAEIASLIQSKKSNSKMLVTGCMVNLHKDQILESYPQVDSVLGSGAIDKVLETIHELEGKNQQHIDGETESSRRKKNRRSFLEQGDTPRFLATPPHYAYLKIAEGCKKQCAFCIIPKIKGRLQSKRIPQLVEEFEAVLEHGAEEVILIAQDLGDYGKDIEFARARERALADDPSVVMEGETPNLANLLKALLASTDDPNLWLRLLYLYPDEITPELLDVMEADTRICRYLDMPIQHSHDDMLRAMRRKTSSAEIIGTIQMLRERLPGVHIRTSLMVGFPGETEEHFEHLLRFVEEMELDNVGVFTYSDESLAVSSKLANHVSEEVKQDRYHRLMMAQWEVVEKKNRARVENKEQLEVVVEGLDDEERIVGRYYGQCPDIDGLVILEGNPSVYAGSRCLVEVTGYEDYDLIGKVVSP
eukprot:Nitzschia sp. Nitz4//scaffold40_size135432//98401//99762//NITZ4_003260-RA/size135432-processed-gene-0.75-mRNA-1//-1//CDS//3329551267//1291//frame0